MNETSALSALSALTHPMRLQTVRHLVRALPDGLTAGEIASRLSASPSKTSFHLNLLSKSGLVTSTRQARNIHYTANVTMFGALLQYLVEDCCQGHPTVRTCCSAPVTGSAKR